MDPASSEPASLIGNPARPALIAAIGPVVFALTGLFVLVRRRTPAFLLARRRRHAFARAESALAQPGANPCAVLRQYLSDRFTIRTGALTPSEAQALLTANGIPDDLAHQFASLMQRHFDASFGGEEKNPPLRTSRASVQPLPLDVESTLSGIERHLNSTRTKHLSKGILSLLALSLSVLHSSASTSAERQFIRDEAVTGMMSAKAPADFMVAASSFQKLVDLGVRNASLFFNQGTALLLADKPGDAITVLRRAERYGGSTPDIRRNLAIAQARVEGLKTPQDLWSRTVLFWHYGLPCADRTLLLAWAFSGLWAAAAIGLLGARRTGKTAATLGLIILITFGSSVLVTLQEESHPQRPVSLMQNFSP